MLIDDKIYDIQINLIIISIISLLNFIITLLVLSLTSAAFLASSSLNINFYRKLFYCFSLKTSQIIPSSLPKGYPIGKLMVKNILLAMHQHFICFSLSFFMSISFNCTILYHFLGFQQFIYGFWRIAGRWSQSRRKRPELST